jgi:hypothetical protein
MRGYRQQEAGFFIQEVYQDWVLPFLVKKIKKGKELVADLERDELEMVATALAQFEAFKTAKERTLSGEIVTPEAIVFETVTRGATHESTRRRTHKRLVVDTYWRWNRKKTLINKEAIVAAFRS